MSGRKETCFVIMPFGDKKDAGGNVIDFNAVYRDVIQKAVEELEIRCVRCDEIEEAGSIDRDMFQHIYESDVAVVDITTLNPNVFYELGVRHALADCITVLLRREGTSIPFNIRGLRVISYADHDDSGREAARNAIKAFIENGRTKRGYGKKDSPVHEALKLRIQGASCEIGKTEWYRYDLVGLVDKQVCVVTGDIQNVRGVDIWVNSENTDMQMARHFDRSVSGVIRYGGAKKDGDDHVEVDMIADELARERQPACTGGGDCGYRFGRAQENQRR